MVNTPVNSGLGTSPFAAANIINQNFSELYGGSGTSATAPQYGADPSGVNDSTSALNSWLQSGQINLVLPPGTYKVSGPLTSSVTDIIVQCYGVLQATTTFTGASNFVLNITGARSTWYDLNIDGAILGNACVADGISIQAGRTVLWRPRIAHIPNTGISLTAVSGDNFIWNCDITQWNNSDSQWGVSGAPYYTADGIYFNQADCYVIGGVTRWCNICLHFSATSHTMQVIGHHPYNGTAGAPQARIDPVIVRAESGAANIWLDSCYFDDGHIDLYSPAVSMRNCFLLQGTTASVFTGDAGDPSGLPHFVRYFANGNAQPFQGDYAFRVISVNASNYPATVTGVSTNPVGYVSNGTNVWTGDYTGVPQVMLNNNQVIRGNDGEVMIDHGEAAYPTSPATQTYYKGANTLSFVYQIGNTTTPTVVTIGNMAAVWTVNSLEITGATTSTLKLGNGGTNIYDDGSNNLFFQTINSDRWELVSNGVLRPVTNATYNIGTAGTNAVRLLSLNATTTGVAVLRMDSTALTGAQTATFVASNKPGSGTTSPDKWIPFNLDGTVHYVPAFL